MALRLTFEITLRSDYHISAGHGLGSGVDSALFRDVDGVPAMRGTTITGLLRNGLWQLLQLPPLKQRGHQRCKASGLTGKDDPSYCGQKGTQDVPCPACLLFGSPAYPKRWQISSARPPELEHIMHDPWNKGSQPIQRVRVDTASRRAEPRKLFSQEDGDTRLRFRFTATCEAEDTSALDEAALLVAAARYVRELGRSRRRGHGECLINLVAINPLEVSDLILEEHQDVQTSLLERFQKSWLENTAAVAQDPDKVTYHGATKSSETPDGSVRIRLVLRTDEPVLIAQRSEAGNQFESLDRITGQTIHGVLASLAARRYNFQGEKWRGNPVYDDFVSVFFSDTISFPVLYPAFYTDHDLLPAIPAPRNLLTCKTSPALEKTRQKHSLIPIKDETDDQRCPECNSALTAVGEYLFWQNEWKKLAVQHRSELHIRIDAQRGRVSAGDMFGYVAIEAGQYFVGDLLCSNEETWKKLQALTGLSAGQILPLRIGKANRRGYGSVLVRFDRLKADEVDTWIGIPFQQRVDATIHATHPIVLTLLTDAVLPDRWGREWMGFETASGQAAEWLQTTLDMPITVQNAFSQARWIDGFHAQVGLPRQRDMALVAGSTVIFTLDSPSDDWLQRLERIEQVGIGIRCNEGFGRVVFNHPIQELKEMDVEIALGELKKLKTASHVLDAETEFRNEWHKVLHNNNQRGKAIKQTCRNQRFAAIARWLHAHAQDPIDTLIAQLDQPEDSPIIFGQPQPDLIKAIGTDEYGDRSKVNYFTVKEKGDEGRKEIQELLRRLQKDYDPSYAPTGVMMLAERIAATATEEGTEQ